jgi:hypothetical protein
MRASHLLLLLFFCLTPSIALAQKDLKNEQCEDSDGGINYFTKGTLCRGSECQEEQCSIEGSVFEEACSGGLLVSCLHGCEDGACLPLLPLMEVIDGHNDAALDRINLIFVGSGYASDGEFLEVVTSILSWDRDPIPIHDEYAIGKPLVGLGFGLFSIEPFKSNKDKFNLWHYPIQVERPETLGQLWNDKTGGPSRYFGLPHSSLVLMVNPEGEPQSIAYPSNSYYSNGTQNKKESISFGIATINMYPDQFSLIGADVLAHELGHSLFNLRDEYLRDDAPIWGINCASSWEDAMKKWGELEGTVDPFYHEWKSLMERNGLPLKAYPTLDQVKIATVAGGCKTKQDSTSFTAFRPSDSSLMNNEDRFPPLYPNHLKHAPVFGSVNRKAIEDILSLFSGKKGGQTQTTLESPIPEPSNQPYLQATSPSSNKETSEEGFFKRTWRMLLSLFS